MEGNMLSNTLSRNVDGADVKTRAKLVEYKALGEDVHKLRRR